MPLVTFIIPAFNAEKHISETILSVIDQDYSEIEILIIDDGSLDRTAEIVYGYIIKDPRIRILRKENSGIVDSLNLGVSEARGKYIARIDADDICLRSRIKLQVELMESNKDVIVCGSYYQLIGQGSGIGKHPVSNNGCKALLNIRGCFAHPAVMIRAEILKKLIPVYSDQYLFAEDYKLWCDLSDYGQFSNIPIPLIKYRIHSEQTSIRRRAEQRRSHNLIAIEQMKKKNVHLSYDEMDGLLWPNIPLLKDKIKYLAFASCILVKKLRPLGGLFLLYFIFHIGRELRK